MKARPDTLHSVCSEQGPPADVYVGVIWFNSQQTAVAGSRRAAAQ